MYKNKLINLAALAAIQGGNAIIPLILFPFLLSKIGEKQFSEVAALEASSFIILTVALYSFDVSGLKIIIKRLNNINKSISRIYYSILYIRLGLFFLCSSLFLIAITVFKVEMLVPAIILLMFPFGVVLQSSYFYQATSNNIPLAVCVLIPRILISALAIMVVDENADLVMACTFLSASYLLSGLLSFFYLNMKLGFNSPAEVKRASVPIFFQGKYLFFGGLFVILYRGSNTLLLTALGASPAAISTYAIAEKYIKMLQAIAFPLTQILAAKLMSELLDIGRNTTMIWSVLWRNTKYQVFLVLILSFLFVVVCVAASSYLNWILPRGMIILMVIMIPAAVFGIMNYMFGTIGSTALYMDSLYAKIVLFNGVVALIVSTILIGFFKELGAALSFVMAEVFLFILIIRSLKKFE